MLILASTSPRRRELIKLFGLDFKFVSVKVLESPGVNESPRDLVERLSREKSAQAAKENRDALVIAADTVVLIDGEILGKPTDLFDAERMLKRLRGRDHTVYSGLTARQGNRQWTQTAETIVRMRDYTNQEIAAYIASGDSLDKAAAYAIQHDHFRPVAHIDGCQANVMGLPLCHLYLALKEFGVTVSEPDRACQGYLNIVCPAAREILKSSH
jgi:nucleoside triphosphate pyrophosphatase